MKILRLIPDRRIANTNTDALASSIHDLGLPWLQRLHGLHVDRQNYLSWEWHLGDGKAESVVLLEPNLSSSVQQHVQTCWPRVTMEEGTDPLLQWDASLTTGADLVLREHYMYSLSIDRRTSTPLPGLLEVLRMLKDGERAMVQMQLVPGASDWALGAQSAYEKLRNGNKPKRVALNGKTIAEAVAKTSAAFALHATALVAEVISGEDIEPEPVELPSKLVDERRISHHSMQKAKYPAFNVSIRIAAMSPDPGRRQVLAKAVGAAFRDLDADNALIMRRVKRFNPWWENVRQRNAPTFKINSDYLSTVEVGRLIQMPTGALQEEYGLSSVEHREFDLPESILSDGIELGTHTFRGQEASVFMPVSDEDEICLPRIVIGGMGTGKTRGFGGNWGAQAVAKGYSVFSIDAAKDELGDEIEAGARKLGVPEDRIIRIRFGEVPFRLDWREASKGRAAANRLAGEALDFFSLHGSEAGVETARYIRLAAKTVGVTRGSLKDMMDLFLDDAVRKSIVSQLSDTRPDLTKEWAAFEKLSDGMKGKVTDPILNRLDILTGDDYLRECLTAPDGIDFTDYMTGGYLVRMHLPKHELGAEAVDILASFLMAKIELAMFGRPEADQIPAFVIADEPHQYKSCATRWERMAVETRKWRVGLVWLFHSWEQIPRGLAEIIKSAGPHYHLYTSSKKTYRDLSEEIAPFTIEEAIKTPRHYAINVIRTGGQTVTPFMAKMSKPPMMWN